MASKHIAASGASAGKWVYCPAKIQCRNGGLHVDSSEVAQVAKSLGKKVTEVTLRDVEKSLVASPAKPQTGKVTKGISDVFTPDVPEELAETYSPNSRLAQSVINHSLPLESDVSLDTYEQEIDQIASLMRKDQRWEQAEKEAASVMSILGFDDTVVKRGGVLDSKHGFFCCPEYIAMENDNCRNTVNLFSLAWMAGGSTDNALKLAFAHALQDKFGMDKRDLEDNWGSRKLYTEHKTFFSLASESIYKNTQAKLTEKSYRLARLTSRGNLRPLSSFTSHKKVIGEFYSDNSYAIDDTVVIVYADVPKERVFGFYGAGMGTSYQHEFLVLGSGKKLPSLKDYKVVPVRKKAPQLPKMTNHVTPVSKVSDKVVSKVHIPKDSPKPIYNSDVPKKGFFARLFRL